MEDQQIELELQLVVVSHGHCPDELLVALTQDDAEMHLYDQLCTWLWRYMPPGTSGFRLMVNIAPV